MATAFFRTIILYLFIILSLRIMGKRQVGELQPSELVVMVMISELAAIPMQDAGVPLLYGILPALTLLSVEVMLSFGILKNLKLRKLVYGTPIIIIENGRILQDKLRDNRFTTDELIEELRLQGVTDISTVKYAILETNGKLGIILYADEMPVTPKTMSLNVTDSGLPVIIVNDGRVLDNNLKLRGLNRNWLNIQMKNHGVDNIKDIFLMTVDEQNSIYFARRE